GAVAVDGGDQLLGGYPAHLAAGLAHGGQAGPHLARDRGVVETEHRQLRRYREAARGRLVEHAAGGVVVGGDDRGRRIVHVQQLARAGDARFERELAFHHQVRIRLDPGLAQAVEVAGQAPGAAAVAAVAGDVADAAVPERDHVGHHVRRRGALVEDGAYAAVVAA